MPETSVGQYPPSAFHFKVVFASDRNITDTSFQEVSGIGSSLETEPYREGGENSSVLQLPTGMAASKLVLKRGVAAVGSGLVAWCRAVLENGFVDGIQTKSINVYLLDENHSPVRAWSFEHAYPVGWEIEGLQSTKNEVAIEKIELHYGRVSRLI